MRVEKRDGSRVEHLAALVAADIDILAAARAATTFLSHRQGGNVVGHMVTGFLCIGPCLGGFKCGIDGFALDQFHACGGG